MRRRSPCSTLWWPPMPTMWAELVSVLLLLVVLRSFQFHFHTVTHQPTVLTRLLSFLIVIFPGVFARQAGCLSFISAGCSESSCFWIEIFQVCIYITFLKCYINMYADMQLFFANCRYWFNAKRWCRSIVKDLHKIQSFAYVYLSHGIFLNWTKVICFFSAFICAFKIKENKKRPRKAEIPFEIQMKEEGSGEGLIRVKEGVHLDFEKRSHYRFYVVAEDCGSPRKQSEK